MSELDMLDLSTFFRALEGIDYVLVKMSDSFPVYTQGSDLDMYCRTPSAASRAIVAVANAYIDGVRRLEVTEKPEKHKTIIDLCRGANLELRFEVFSALPRYRSIELKDWYFRTVLDRSTTRAIQTPKGERFTVRVPHEVDDAVLRYVEFLEWYETRSDKVKHLDYVLSKLETELSRDRFLDTLHYYTRIPDNAKGTAFANSHFYNKYVREIVYQALRVKQLGVRRTVTRLVRGRKR